MKPSEAALIKHLSDQGRTWQAMFIAWLYRPPRRGAPFVRIAGGIAVAGTAIAAVLNCLHK